MFSLILWVASFLFRLLILFRGLQGSTLKKFPYFFSYILSTCVADILIYAAWIYHPAAYQKTYWGVQFATLLLGCGIVLEIFQHVLTPYPGAERFATVAVLVTFGLIFCFALGYQFLAPNSSAPKGTPIELERDVRTVQAIFLFGIFAVISYYRIPIGKNLKGMIFGYGLYIGTSLLSLAFRSYAGHSFDSEWKIIQPLSYAVGMFIWLIALWSFRPNPAPDPGIHLEEDYEALAARTKRTLVAMRSHLAGSRGTTP